MGLPSQVFPQSTVPRFDGSGLETFPITGSGHGNPQQLAQANMTDTGSQSSGNVSVGGAMCPP
jgi:hypothetical protein